MHPLPAVQRSADLDQDTENKTFLLYFKALPYL
jgi:hypothetical protein